jgi:two-component system cell cycle response regulator
MLGLALHVLHATLDLGGPGLDGFVKGTVYDSVLALAAIACLARGVLVRAERAAWLLIGGGLLSWTVGDVYWTLALADRDPIPYPSVADAFYVAMYPSVYLGLIALVRARATGFRMSLWLDGAIGGLAVGALGVALLYPAIRGATHADPSTVAVNLAYPLGDVFLLSFVVAAISLTGWRPERGLVLIGAGLALVAVADGSYLYRQASDSYTEGTLLDSTWLAGALLVAFASWSSAHARERVQLEGLRLLAMPSIFALLAVSLQFYAVLGSLSRLALGLASACLVVVIVRMAATFKENLRLLAASREEAIVDPLTGLGNRRLLLADLDGDLTEPLALALFDLDGFKSYNDAFGHPVGDGLLERLGRNLAAAVAPDGRAYRLGGDEFCVIVPAGGGDVEPVIAAASAALSEQGEGFSITSSWGSVLIPEEADTSAEALRLADKRMYAQKSWRPRSPERQTRNVLLRVLREREPELRHHLQGVAQVSFMLAQAVDLEGEELDEIARAAELHDVGKIGIPDAILHKSAPLDEAEWKLMREHTLIGERILASAPAMAPVATLVRSTHERWDGRGYPDGLAGEAIPLGSRIIAVCDAYQAMTKTRAWRATRSGEEAIAELRSHAGEQFDPGLVEAFCTRVYPDLVPFAAPPEDTPVVADAAPRGSI